MNIHWPLLGTEIGLAALAIGGLVLDILLPNDERRGRIMTRAALAGIALLFLALCTQWGVFGRAFGGSFVQDGLSFYFSRSSWPGNTKRN
jgi:hypothetical protein